MKLVYEDLWRRRIVVENKMVEAPGLLSTYIAYLMAVDVVNQSTRVSNKKRLRGGRYLMFHLQTSFEAGIWL